MKGVRIKSPYQDRPVRPNYRLTDKGRDHYRVVMAIVTWGDRHYASPAGAPLLHRHKTCGCDLAPVMTCWECQAPVTTREVETRAGGRGPSARSAGHAPYAICVFVTTCA